MDILDRRRVYIVPTRPGFALFGVIGLILIGATNYDNALAYILSFLLLGLMFSAMLRTWRNLKGIALTTEEAVPVHAGMPARFELLLHDPAGLARYAFSFRRLLPRSPRFWWWRPRTEGFGQCETLEGGAATATLSVPTVHRGWLVLGRVEMSSQFPLGVFRTWGYFKPTARCLVYPVAAGKLPLPGVTATAVDEAGSAGPGVDDFAGLRAYVAGDSLRSVHWKASARSDDLVELRHSKGAVLEGQSDGQVEIDALHDAPGVVAKHADVVVAGLVLCCTAGRAAVQGGVPGVDRKVLVERRVA
jgi:uncharacterized protein (DUF58 family)